MVSNKILCNFLAMEIQQIIEPLLFFFIRHHDQLIFLHCLFLRSDISRILLRLRRRSMSEDLDIKFFV